MEVIQVRNVHQALPQALDRLNQVGVERNSRNGSVRMFPTPVTTVYDRPTERVIFWPQRDANPFFHLLESLWMLAGHNDVHFLKKIVARMAEYSDDGVVFNGAYGYRWRHHFGRDQLIWAADQLRRNPDNRRVVVSMWDGAHDVDVAHTSKDVPCNTHIYFSVNHNEELDMTVCNRSNDLVWGCYGANAVHLSMLQEYMATMVSYPVGTYYQMSNNLHAYRDTLEPVAMLADKAPDPFRRQIDCPYVNRVVVPTELLVEGEHVTEFNIDLTAFMRGCLSSPRTNFFRYTAVPMYKALTCWKEKKYDGAMHIVNRGMDPDSDWRLAAQEWMQRRIDKRLARERLS